MHENIFRIVRRCDKKVKAYTCNRIKIKPLNPSVLSKTACVSEDAAQHVLLGYRRSFKHPEAIRCWETSLTLSFLLSGKGLSPASDGELNERSVNEPQRWDDRMSERFAERVWQQNVPSSQPESHT